MTASYHALCTGVRAQRLGDSLSAVATTGDTVLHVNDVTDFSEDGGFYTMPGLTFGALQLYVQYSGIDDDTSSIFLPAPGLLTSSGSPFPVDTEVYIWDNANNQPAVQYIATIDQIDGEDGTQCEAVVDQAIAHVLAQTMRNGGAGESVTVVEDGVGLAIAEVHGRNNALASMQYLQGGMTTRQTDIDAGVDILGVDSGTPGVYLFGAGGDALAQMTPDGIATNDTVPRIVLSNTSDPLFDQGGLIAFYVVGASWDPASLAAEWVAGPPNIGTIQLNGPQGPSGTGAAGLGLSYVSGGTGSIANLDGKTINIGASANSITVHDDLAVTGAVNATGAVNGTTVHGTGTVQTDSGFFDNSLAPGGTLTGANINASGHIVRAPSSRRYKSNIKPLKLDVARKILDLEPVTFTLKEEARNKNRRTYPGFIAEQAAEVGAELWVDRDVDGNPDGFRYAETVAALVLLAREDRDQIADLKATVARLEADFAALTKEG